MHYAIVPEAQKELIDQYAATLQSRIIDLVGRAIGDLEPCRLQHGSGSTTFAINRRNNPAAEVPARRAAGTLVGPNDHDVPVLAVRTGEDVWKAIVFGYACRPSGRRRSKRQSSTQLSSK
jgi:hypothetical protein